MADVVRLRPAMMDLAGGLEVIELELADGTKVLVLAHRGLQQFGDALLVERLHECADRGVVLAGSNRPQGGSASTYTSPASITTLPPAHEHDRFSSPNVPALDPSISTTSGVPGRRGHQRSPRNYRA